MTTQLNLDVGGYRHTLDANDILKFPASRLAVMLRSCAPEEIIKIERDGRVFQYVASYLVCEHIPRNSYGTFRLDTTTLAYLNEEAVYYGLDQLSADCKQSCRTLNNSDFGTYISMHKHIQEVKDHHGQGEKSFQVEFICARTTRLLQALSEIWAPFCKTGTLYNKFTSYNPTYLHKQSTIYDLKIDELLSGSQVDPEQMCSYSILATDLASTATENATYLAKHDLDAFASRKTLTITCDRLLIHQVGYSQDQIPVLTTLKHPEHIGTLVLILNSTYTGGELEVTHGGRTEVVTGPYSWVAMYGDCLHKINPVTSGTRVSLIYDIYATPRPMLHSGVRVRKSKYYTSVWNGSALDVDAHKARGVLKDAASQIRASISKELRKTNTLYVSLHRLYPEYLNAQLMAQPDVLTHGDRTLYDILTHDNRYDVSFKLVTVYSTSTEWITYEDESKHICTPSAQLFPDSFNESNPALTTPYTADSFLLYMRQNKKIRLSTHAKLIVAASPAEECTVCFRESAEWTGTESLPGILIYILRALQVRKKSG